jgi:hypothetical protein
VRLHCKTSDPSLLRWLEEFVGPDFDALGDGPPGTVVCESNPAAFEALRRQGPDPERASIEMFALDGSMIALSRWHDAPGQLTTFDEDSECFYRRGSDATHVTVLAPRSPLRVAVLRVAREMAMARQVSRGDLLVHAAAFGRDGRTHVIAGAKHSGKTTLLLHCLGEAGTAYVANDRVAISSGRSFEVGGIPTIVSLRASTLDHVGAVGHALRTCGYHHRLTIDEADRVRLSPQTHDDVSPPDLSPAQLSKVLGVPRCGSQPLGVLIFPRHSGLPGGVAVHQLSSDETARYLRASLFRPDASSIVGEFFLATTTGVADRTARCLEIARSVPGFVCELGLDAYRVGPSVITESIDRAVAELPNP